MKFVGNFKDFIKPEWIDYVKNNLGEKHPKQGGEYNVAASLESVEGFKISTGWELFRENLNNFPFDITPPIFGDNAEWWIIKIVPGGQMPIHQDYSNCPELSSRRYWVPFQDHVTGHVFAYGSEHLSNYKAGDVFEYTDIKEWHGAANISYSTRITMNITIYETIR
jgi:hypothetical protein